jgi:hypothetical protein
MTLYCWHRPGHMIGRTRCCRYCGVGIEECPCSYYGRYPDGECTACRGSAWVAIVRSARAAFRAAVEA